VLGSPDSAPPPQDAHQLADILQAHRHQLVGWHLPAPGQIPGGGANDNMTSSSSESNEAEGLRQVVADYTKARLVRVCRMQRMAAEGCGLPQLR